MAAVEVKGVVELRKALRKFEPTLAKELSAEMRAALSPIVRSARGYAPARFPLSNWNERDVISGKFPLYNGAAVKSGIGFKTSGSKPNRSGFKSQAQIYNKTAAGAIYETAGRKNPNSVFVRNLEAKYPSKMVGRDKMQGRAMFRAYEENEGKAQDGVIRAIEKAARNFRGATIRAYGKAKRICCL